MTVERRFTTEGTDVYETVEWSRRDSRITNPDGSVVFEMLGAEIPAQWSQVAADIMVSKYFRKAGVPQFDDDGNPILDGDGNPVTGPEQSARQVIKRLASTWCWWGEQNGYFASATDAAAFEDEIAYMLLHQMAAPNSPQWFNTGLAHEYGITGTEQGFWYVDPETEEVVASKDAYSRPAPHACFPEGTRITLRDGFKHIEKIEPGDVVLTHEGRYRTVSETMQRQVEEDLVELSLWAIGSIEQKEQRDVVQPMSVEGVAFSLTATANHPVLAFRSAAVDAALDVHALTPEWIEAEKLEVNDYVVVGQPTGRHIGGRNVTRVLTKSHESFGGTVYNFQVDEDESYIANGVAVHNCFINSVDDDLVNNGGIMDLWVREARLFKMGAGSGANFSRIRAEGEPLSGGGKSSGLMSFLKVGDRAAGAIKSGGTTRRAAKMVIVDIDHPDIEQFINWKAEEEKKVRALVAGGYSSDFNGEAYATVSGQNSNNSVRLSNAFLNAVVHDAEWDLLARTDRSVMKTVRARDLWNQIADAAWQSADPGLQFQGTINEWHTCPAEGEIRASNPCSEYQFLDNTACNLASLNLRTFYDDHTGSFDIAAYQHAVRLWTIVLEISVTMAQFPSREIAIGSYDYRTLGLGYANLGSLLMRMGIPYDSDHGRAIAGSLTAILTGHAYATSAEMAEVLGPFPKFGINRDSMLRVIRNHRRAAYNKDQGDYEAINHLVMGINSGLAPLDMLEAARTAWDTALTRGEQNGFRNAQVSVTAPTGTIGLLMDCDTTGVEPDFALVKFKKLAGGGYFKIANQSIAPALKRLGYSDNTIQAIIEYVVGTNSLARSPQINMATLIAKGFTADDIDKIEAVLSGVFEIGFAFNQWTLGEDVMLRLGFTPDQYNDPGFSMLKALGFTDKEIQQANNYICGHQTIEGAPHLRDEHLAVFDTANRNGRTGKRFIHHTGHIKMMAAAQPFISGAQSKTVNMPNEVTREDIAESYKMSWELGLKAMAIYRDGSKASQPLSSQSDDGYADDEPAELEDALVDELELVSHGRVPWHEAMRPGISPSEAYADMKRPRFLLPARRSGYTQEARVGGHKVFVRTGEYEDGTLGELFIDLAKEGATLRGILSCFAIAVSKGLQYGVPLEEYVDTFTFQTFEPRGMVEGHPNIKMSNSLIDYVFRALGVEYLKRDELAQVPPDRSRELPEPPKGLAVDAGVQLDLTDAEAEVALDATVEAARFADGEVVAPVTGGSGVVETSQDAYRNSGAISTGGPATNGGGVATAAAIQQRAVQAAMADKMGDAPICETCGAITVRNGSCYVCLGCGGTTGCS
jgi:ribonucleoside-diphosphate reductase alpha chain